MAIGGDGERKAKAASAAAQGWETPKRAECRIPAAVACPPPPRKKKSPAATGEKTRAPPKGGYFCPPDLEALFAMKPRREACA